MIKFYILDSRFEKKVDFNQASLFQKYETGLINKCLKYRGEWCRCQVPFVGDGGGLAIWIKNI